MTERYSLLTVILTTAKRYFTEGLGMLQQDTSLFLRVAAVFSLPALASAVIAALLPIGLPWKYVLLFLLQSITTVVAPVVFMMVVGAVAKGTTITLRQAFKQGLPWLPRYVWTNVHTSLIFWAPMGPLFLLHGWLSPAPDRWNPETLLLLGAWSLALGGMAIFLHAHTVLAPFLAVHSNLPGSLAAWEAWRLCRRHFPLVLTNFVIAVLPAVVPLAVVVAVLFTFYGSLPVFALALPHLTGVALQCIRLVLIPAVYMLYKDLWDQELARRRFEGDPDVPSPVQRLVSITGSLPAFPLGRN